MSDTSYLTAMQKFRSGETVAAAPRRLPAVAEKLTAAKRRRIPSRQFALPARRALPIEDHGHAVAAASRLEQMRKRGTVSPAEYRRAKAAINRKLYLTRSGETRTVMSAGRKRRGSTREDAMKRKRKANGQFTKGKRPAKRRHARAAAPVAQVPRRRKRTTLRRRSARRMSREVMAPIVRPVVIRQAAPRVVAAEAPRRRRSAPRRRRAREAAAPIVVMAGAPRRRARRTSRRRSYVRERVCANRKRLKNGKFAKGRTGSRRVSRRKKHRRSRVKGYTAVRRGKRVRVRNYLREEDLLANPIGGGLDGVLENPITIGETWTLFAVAGAGWVVTDLVSRYLETVPSGYTPSTGQQVLPNGIGQLGMPSWTNIFVQAGISVASLGLGGYMGKGGGGIGVAALNGLGVGAGLHLIGQLFSALVAKMAGSATSATGTTPTGTLSRLYAGEIAAQYQQTQALATAGASGSVVPGFAGVPGVLGALVNPANPYGVPSVQLPNGQYAAMFNPARPYGQPGSVNPANPYGAPTQLTQPVAGSAVPMAAPIQAPGSGASMPSSSDCGCMGFTPYSTFPE
jgi:hypothetical protein